MKPDFYPGDQVVLPSGRVGTVLREAYDGRYEVQYGDMDARQPDGQVVLIGKLLKLRSEWP